MRARLRDMPKGRPQVDMPSDVTRQLIRAGRKRDSEIDRARARYAEHVAALVELYGAGAVGRALGISRQSVHALLARRGGQSDIQQHGQATKDEPGE